MDSFYSVVRYISTFSPLVGLTIFFVFRAKRVTLVNFLALLLAISFVSDSVGFVLTKMKLSTWWALDVFGICELGLIGLIYMEIFEKRFRNLLVAIIICTVSVFTVLTVSQQSIGPIIDIKLVFACAIMMSIAFAHLKVMANKPVVYIDRFAPFWITTGVFFYCSLSFMIVSTSKYLSLNFAIEDFRLTWAFHNATNIFKNLCFAAAIWWSARRDVQQL
jgi:hypothetical protein